MWALLFFFWPGLAFGLPPPAPAPAPLAPSPASRPSAEDEPFFEGIRLCRLSEWEKASVVFEEIQKKKLFQLRQPQRAQLFLLLGLVHANLLRLPQSESSFEKALLLNPCIQMPSLSSIAPQIRASFQSLREGFAPACKRLLGEKGQPPPPRPRPFQSPRPTFRWIGHPSKPIYVASWWMLGSGSLALTAALVTGGLSFWDETQRNQQPYDRQGTLEYLRLDRSARERAFVANVLFGIAGATLFTGFALYVSQKVTKIPVPPEEAPKVIHEESMLYTSSPRSPR